MRREGIDIALAPVVELESSLGFASKAFGWFWTVRAAQAVDVVNHRHFKEIRRVSVDQGILKRNVQQVRPDSCLPQMSGAPTTACNAAVT